MKKSTKKILMSCAMLTALTVASSCSLQGPAGPQGEQGTQGEKGDTGEQGLKGDQGNPGADGKDGSRIRTGEGAPSNGIGSDGDLYVDTSTGDLYEMKESVWVKTGNIRGSDGKDGKDGVSVVSIAKTATEGKADTYTITYSDGSTNQFVVTNGEDGSQGVQGVPGKDGHTPNITIGDNGHWYVDGADTGIPARGEKGDKGDKGDKGQDAVTYVPCIFNNYDGTKLWEFYFEKGTDVVYAGPTPVKPDEKDGENVAKWAFIGWDKSLTNIQKPMIFTAKFECLYNCTFVNYDGTILESCKVNRGESAVYSGETPKKAPEVSGDQTIEWRFSGWDKPLANITKDTVFTATFDAPNAIKCTFKNYDGSLLGYGYCGVGGTVSYSGAAPSKPDNDDGNGTVIRPEFIGWDKSLKNIKTATTFTAQFAETTYYRCDFVNYDGTVLQSSLVFDGGTPAYDGVIPTRPKTAVGTTVTTYSFQHWDKPLTDISAPTMFSAVYYATTFTSYRVDFLNSDGSLLYGDYFEQGTTAYCPDELLPWSYDDENVSMLIGWDVPVSNLSSPLRPKAIIRAIPRSQNGEWPQTKETDNDVISALNKLKPDQDGYCRYRGCRYGRGKTWFGESVWRRVEPIHWMYLASDGNDVFVVSKKSLDYESYSINYSGLVNGFYANNYKNSNIRAYLNGWFLNRAFLDDSRIITTVVDNSPASTGSNKNPYACENTSDKIFLLSFEEHFRFDNVCRTLCDNLDGKQTNWWLRSPSSEYSNEAACRDDLNYFIYHPRVDYENGVRPALHFRFN